MPVSAKGGWSLAGTVDNSFPTNYGGWEANPGTNQWILVEMEAVFDVYKIILVDRIDFHGRFHRVEARVGNDNTPPSATPVRPSCAFTNMYYL